MNESLPPEIQDAAMHENIDYGDMNHFQVCFDFYSTDIDSSGLECALSHFSDGSTPCAVKCRRLCPECGLAHMLRRCGEM